MKKALYILIAASFVTGLAASAAAQTAAPEQGKEELKLQLPKPMFIGHAPQHQDRQPRNGHRQAPRTVLRPQGDQASFG